MVISIRFKDKNKVFRGKVYDFLLHEEEEIPKEGDIVRLLDESFDYRFYGTRVRVEAVRKRRKEDLNLEVVRYIKKDLD